jgi:preprotein translocase subunit SecG
MLQEKLTSSKPAPPKNIAGSLFLIMIILLIIITFAMVYIYKRETDHKLHENLIDEEDNEGGYVKLD